MRMEGKEKMHKKLGIHSKKNCIKNTNVCKKCNGGGGQVFIFLPPDNHNDTDDYLPPSESAPYRYYTGRENKASLGGGNLLPFQ